MLKITSRVLVGRSHNVIKLTTAASYSSDAFPNAGGTLDRMFYNWFPSRLLKEKWSKMICIEGNIGVGKADFALKLANRFDLKYYPTADVNYDLRRRKDVYKFISDETLEWELNPDSLAQRSLAGSIDYFLQNPEDWEHTVYLRFHQLTNRNYQYADALLHLLHTGQGCALVRSFYSDKVFAQAQRAMRWFHDKPLMSNQTGMAYKYYEKKHFTINQYLLPPHTILYLNMPAEEAYERVQESGDELKKLLPLEYYRQTEIAYEQNLEEARKNGVNVVDLNISKFSADDLITDLNDAELLEVEFSKWAPVNRLDSNLRELKKYNGDYLSRVSLNNGEFYHPVEAAWKPGFTADQLPREAVFNSMWEKGFDPRKDKLYLLRSNHMSRMFGF